jgi:hypothetical protein
MSRIIRKTARTAAVSMSVLLVLCTVALVQASTPNNGQGNSNIIAQNMDTNTGNPDANVVASYLSPDGTPEDSLGAAIPPLAAAEFAVSETGIGDAWVGSAVLYSDKELASVVNLLYEGGASPGDKTAAAYTGFSETNDLWYLPFVFVRSQVSQISVQNADDETATVCIAYYQRSQSVPTAEVCEDIEAAGSRFYDLGIPGGYVPDLPALIGGSNWSGSAVVEAQDGEQIAVVLVNQYPKRTAAYVGITQPSDTLIAPRVGRRALFQNGSLNWKKYGIVSLQNPNVISATVDVSFYSTEGGTLDLFVDDLIIPPNQMTTFNLQSGGALSQAQLDQLDYAPGDDVIWSGVVVAESDEPLFGIVVSDYQPKGGASMYNMMDPSAGSYTLYVPSLYRVACGSQWCPVSRLSVANFADDQASIDLSFYDRNGDLEDSQTRTIQGDDVRVFYMARSDYDSFGTNWMGSVYVTSDRPIAAVVDTLWTQTLDQSTYNAIND